MPSRRFTSGRKFSTTTSAFLTIFLSTATPSGDLRFSVMLRLLRCRFWKSDPSRGPPRPSPDSICGGISILMTLAPQSASWRTQVGPDRTRVRSSTVKRERAFEALGVGMADVSHAGFAACGYRDAPEKTPRTRGWWARIGHAGLAQELAQRSPKWSTNCHTGWADRSNLGRSRFHDRCNPAGASGIL